MVEFTPIVNLYSVDIVVVRTGDVFFSKIEVVEFTPIVNLYSVDIVVVG